MRRVETLLRRGAVRWRAVLQGFMAASVVLLFAAGYHLTSTALYRTIDQTVLEQLMLLSHRPPSMLAFMVASRLDDADRIITDVGLFSPNGSLITGNIATLPRGLALDSRVYGGHLTIGGGLPAKVARIAGKRLADGRILVVGRDIADVEHIQATLVRAFLLCLVPAFAIGLFAVWFAGLQSRRRLARLQSSARRLAAGRLAERFPAAADGDALDHATQIMNNVLDHLETLVGALQCEGQAIAHDIRTPLTVARARLERARAVADIPPLAAGLIDGGLAGLDRALAIVAAMLRIAEIEQTDRRAAFAAFDLALLVQEAFEAYLPVAEMRGLELVCDTRGAWQLYGDRDLMLEAIANLLENALKFTPSGGRVRIALQGDAARPCILVADTGPGIPPAERAQVLRRYHRGDRARPGGGIGLGLSLVAAVMALHGFRLEISDAAPGCAVTLRCWAIGRSTTRAETMI